MATKRKRRTLSDSSQADIRYSGIAATCTECRRRKQKCDGKWPCNQCQKRKVLEKCTFSGHQSPTIRKPSIQSPGDDQATDSTKDTIYGYEFRALGYMNCHISADWSFWPQRALNDRFAFAPPWCWKLQETIKVVNSRRKTDELLQHFFANVNYRHYIIYPASFLEEYCQWWSNRSSNRDLPLEWTCLLLMLCARSAQSADAKMHQNWMMEYDECLDDLSATYRNTAHLLMARIPLHYKHLVTLQYLSHSCIWYMYEAEFVEAWHILNAAIREAQELESCTRHISDFDSEMRRKVWRVLDVLDCELSTLLSRPRIIDTISCDIETIQDSPSLLPYIKSQSELVHFLWNRFSAGKISTSPTDICEYLKIVENWIAQLQSEEDSNDNLDMTDHDLYSCIVQHRHFLHILSYCIMLRPLRPFLCKQRVITTPNEHLQLKDHGIQLACSLTKALISLLDDIYLTNAESCVTLLSIYHIAAWLSIAILFDKAWSIPGRREIIISIDIAASALKSAQDNRYIAEGLYRMLQPFVYHLGKV